VLALDVCDGFGPWWCHQRNQGFPEHSPDAYQRQQSETAGHDHAGSNRHARQYTIGDTIGDMREQSNRSKLTNPSDRALSAANGLVGVGSFALLLALSLGVPGTVFAAGPKYYFELHEVQSRVPLNADMRAFAGDALKAELASRPEWQSDLGTAKDRDAVLAELKKRKLSGFDVIVKIAEVKKEVKEPNPGSRLKRLAVSVKLSVLGTTLPGEKMAFAGDGEAGAETEVTDRRMDAEADSLIKDAIKDAVKQAVDQAVLKLGIPQSAPLNESKRKRKKS
jgi:hypothetical protein